MWPTLIWFVQCRCDLEEVIQLGCGLVSTGSTKIVGGGGIHFFTTSKLYLILQRWRWCSIPYIIMFGYIIPNKFECGTFLYPTMCWCSIVLSNLKWELEKTQVYTKVKQIQTAMFVHLLCLCGYYLWCGICVCVYVCVCAHMHVRVHVCVCVCVYYVVCLQ